MALLQPKKTETRRPGVIMLVVLAMLTLLAIIGITFVMYASSLEQCSEAALDEQKADFRARFDPETALSMFLGQFVYDVEDDASGRYSVLRGHSLARDLYGYQASKDNNGNILPMAAHPLDRPFGGAGYTNPDQPNFLGQATISGQPNVPYTAPDNRHWYLAKLGYNQQGQLIVSDPSFWRNATSANPATTSATFRYRPGVEMASGFPAYPTQAQQYDVQNLQTGIGPDSIWIDINAPIMTLPNGRRFKMLVAPLIVDLDGRLNAVMAGNRMTTLNNNWFHGSHEGYGPWEGNLDRVVSLLASQGDPVLTSLGVSALQSTVLSTKYGTYGFPFGYTQAGGGGGGGGGGSTSNYSPRAHNQVNFNGGLDPNPQGLTQSVPSYLPGSSAGAQPFQAFPYFHPGVFGNWAPVETSSNGQANGNFIHPNGYNPLFPNGGLTTAQNASATNLALAIRDMGPLMLWRSDKDNFTKDATNTVTPVKQAFAPLLNSYGLSPQNTRSNLWDHITLVSADFDKPGLYPAIDNKLTHGLQWASTDGSVKPSWPRRIDNNVTQPAAAEQNALGQATRELTRYARINLTSFGPDYPSVDATTGQYAAADSATVASADLGRQLLARKILEGLCAATGSFNPFAQDMPADFYDSSKPSYFFSSTNNAYKASIWLAQLAVNIVDFVDPDEVMTRLEVKNAKDNGGSSRIVYGTELPKVVINEVYAQADNSAADYAKTSGVATDDYTVSIFLELANPLNNPTDANNVNRPNTAVIQVQGTTTHTVYEIEVAQTVPSTLRDPFATSGGNTDLSGVVGYTSNPLTAVGSSGNPWKDATGANGTLTISPAGSKFNTTDPRSGNDGFLWIGPTISSSIQDTGLQTAWTYVANTNTVAPLEQPSLKYTWAKAQATPTEATILLRRLVDPGKPADPNTNPYVLVDYVSLKKDMVQDARKRDTAGTVTPVNVTERKSFGRRQPYAGKDYVGPTDTGAYNASTKTNAGAPLHTFGSWNFAAQPAALTNSITAPTETAETPDWLAHFDRVPASPVALLMVSTYRPHELCQKFLDKIDSPMAPGTPIWATHQHSAAWMDEMTGLQRFFDLVQTHGEHALTNSSNQQVPLFPTGGRFQGRVNLNTVPIYQDAGGIYRSPVLEALFDANGTSRFTQDQIRALINTLGTNRAAGNYFYGGASPLTRNGSVFQSQASAMVNSNDPWQIYVAGGGVDFRSNGNLLMDPFALDPTAQPNGAPPRNQMANTHPMVRLDALSKIFNQTTTRSNVFAIWLTVGFFEVTDASTFPAKLGGEIGAASGRQIRHRMFAIVDRSRIKAFETTSTAGITPQTNTTEVVTPTYVGIGDAALQVVPAPTAFTDTRTGKSYNLITLSQYQPLVLTFDPDKENEETVEAFLFNGQLFAQFRRSHNTGCKVISRGNPGPMKNYDHKDDTDVVLYWTIIE